MDNVILITGVSGFLGRYLAQYLANKEHNVVGVDIVSPENSPSHFLKKYLSVKLPDPSFIQLIKEIKPTICIHCAGRASVNASMLDPYNDYIQGPELTFYILNYLHEIVPKCKVLFLSSAAVYGNPSTLPIQESFTPSPISIYGFNKWQSEIICREFYDIYKQPTASLRVFSAYGPGLRRQVIWDICQKALHEKKVCLHGTGNESRDFIHVFDIAKAIENVIKSAEFNGEAYNLGSGRQIEISYIANLVFDYMNLKNIVLNFSNIEPAGNPINWQADIHKISQLGFSPIIPFEEGLQSYVNWFLSEWGKDKLFD